MKKLAVCECCGNIFMMGDRVWKYRGDKLCSEKCARKAEFLGKQGKWKNDIDKKEKENKKMKEIKLIIDGKEVQLTDEQLKALGIEIEEKRKNPFERVKGKEYYCIDGEEICMYRDYGNGNDKSLYKQPNYFNDKQFAEQVALHQLLYRKLLKFAYDNNCVDTAEWRRYSKHWFIYYNWDMKEVNLGLANVEQHFSTVYFSTAQAAYQAIKEVAEPFMKEHPEFKW